MRNLVFILSIFLACGSSYAESREWTTLDGRSFKAEFSLRMGSDAVFKTEQGKQVRIPVDQLSKTDQKFIMLETPPDLEMSFSRTTDKRRYPVGYNGNETKNPTAFYNQFMVKIRQRSAGEYNLPLHLEYFVIGEEVDGDNYILLDHQELDFTLTTKNKRTYVAQGDPVQIINYTWIEKVGSPLVMERGEKYGRYLVIITDTRGDIVAYRTPSDWLFDVAENLRTVPVNRHFDKTGTRVGPPRPPTRHY